MLNYNKLFDIIYSETLPESVKCDVLDKVNSRINESELLTLNESELNPMTSFISSLIESNITEEGLYEIIDLTFESISEEIINEVSDELRKQAAQSSLARRRSEAGWAEAKERELGPRISKDKGSVGLADMRKKWATQDRIKADKRLQHAENVASRDTAKNKLKDTVGKIFKHKDTPVGLSGIKGTKNSTTTNTATNTSTPTTNHTNSTTTSASTEPKKPVETREERLARMKKRMQAGSQNDGSVITPESPGQKKRREATAKLGQHVGSGETIATESPKQRLKRSKKERSEHGEHVGSGPTIELGTNKTEEPKVETKTKTKTSKTKKSKGNAQQLSLNLDEQPKAKKTKTDKEAEAPKTKTTKKTVAKNPHEKGTRQYYEYMRDNATTDKQRKTAENGLSKLLAKDASTTEKANTLKGKKKAGVPVTNEALTEVIYSLVNSTISEESFSEIMEMISNKKAAEKAVDREHETFNKKMDTLSKAEETKAKTGIDPLSTEQRENITKEAEKAGSRYETFRRLANNKYNLNK